MNRCNLILLLTAMITTSPVLAQDDSPWRVEGGLTFSHFQQQVKTDIGTARGDRLVNEFLLGLMASGTYGVTEHIAVGAFVRVDRGERMAARFNGFDADGKTRVKDAIGGLYSEIWLGPLMRASWKSLSAEIGYALVGRRSDMARTDLPSTTGDTEGVFTTHPTIAWLFTIGANVPLVEPIEVIVKIEYRASYYSERGGNPLAGNIEHGRQSIYPILGLAWIF